MPDLMAIKQSAEAIFTKAKSKTPPPTLLDVGDLIAQLARNQVLIIGVLEDHINDKGEHWR